MTTYEDVRPRTPLADAALLTNSRGEPSLGAELRAEIDTADEVDLLCAFVKWHGLRLLEPELQRLRQRGAPLRVITTTYMGATERAALDRLVRELGAEVRIQYDAARTRLHAKAWMLRRATEYDTAYVGSSNLSRAALLDGVEWNVRLSHIATRALLAKFRITFDCLACDTSCTSRLQSPIREADPVMGPRSTTGDCALAATATALGYLAVSGEVDWSPDDSAPFSGIELGRLTSSA